RRPVLLVRRRPPGAHQPRSDGVGGGPSRHRGPRRPPLRTGAGTGRPRPRPLRRGPPRRCPHELRLLLLPHAAAGLRAPGRPAPRRALARPPPMMTGLPVTLNLHDVPCLVVGAGSVGARKAESLRAAGARVTVVAPEHNRTFRPGDSSGHRLVVAATGDPTINDAVEPPPHPPAPSSN